MQIDVLIIFFTILNFFSREISLILVNKTLKKLNAPIDLCELALRKNKLKPIPPPGSNDVVLQRDS